MDIGQLAGAPARSPLHAEDHEIERVHRFDLQPARAAAAATSGRGFVKVRPEQVVEIAFDGVQGSSRYPGGMALRFARVLRYRDDKGPADADTIDTVRALYEHSA